MNCKDDLGFDLIVAWFLHEDWGWHFTLSNRI